MNNSELIDRAQGIARTLTYGGEEREAKAKHTLHELCHRLGQATVKVRHQKGKMIVMTAMGQTRFMTFCERVFYRLFNIVPPINGWRGDK